MVTIQVTVDGVSKSIDLTAFFGTYKHFNTFNEKFHAPTSLGISKENFQRSLVAFITKRAFTYATTNESQVFRRVRQPTF